MEEAKAPATLRNREPILEVLKQYVRGRKNLLEIGSGTAEHAVYFAKHFPELNWVTSDVQPNHKVIKETLTENKVPNVAGPLLLKVGEDDFPRTSFQYVFSANCLHIMSWKEGKTLFKLLGKRLREGAHVFFYGPFNYDGQFTSESNKKFNDWLQERNPKSAIRNFEDVLKSMEKFGFELIKDHEMPANNRLLVFRRLPFQQEQHS